MSDHQKVNDLEEQIRILKSELAEARKEIADSTNDRKKIEKILRENEERYRLLFQQSPVGIVHTDAKGVLVDVNEVYSRMIGADRERLIGIDVFKEVTDPNVREAVADALNGKIASFTGEFRSIVTGKIIACNFTVKAILDANGDLLGGIAIVEDISEQKKLQESLRKSELYLKQAQAVAGVGSWHLDMVNNELTWSDQTYEIFGIDHQKALTVSSFFQSVHPNDRVMVESVWQTAMKGEAYDIEHRIVVNGQTRWVHEKAQVAFDTKGMPVEVIGTVHDITDRKQAEEKNLRSKEEWKRTFNSLSDLVAILDDQFRIVKMNKAMAEKLGVNGTEIQGTTCYESIHQSSEPPPDCPHKKLLADGKEHSTVTYEERLGGDYLVNVSPLRDPKGKLIGSVHTARDISELKRAERALRKSEEKFRAIFDQAAVGVSLTASDTGQLIQVNRKYCDIVGYTEEELQSITFQELTHPDDLEDDLTFMQKLRDGKITDFSMEKRYIRRDGAEVWVLLTVSPKLYVDGKTSQHIAIIQDITDRKMMEAKVKTLSGFLPICSSCKKVRDDRGYWSQIECYISKHSEAEFSHSLCPQCARKLYPDLDIPNDEKKG